MRRLAESAWSEISKVARESKLLKTVRLYDITGVGSLLTSDDVALRAIMVASDDKAVNDSLKNILDLRDPSACENMMKSISIDFPPESSHRAGRRRNARRHKLKAFVASKFALLIHRNLKRLCNDSDKVESLWRLLHSYQAISVKSINLMSSTSLNDLAGQLENTDAPFACREMHLAATYARRIAQYVVEEEEIVRAILKVSGGDLDVENIDLENVAAVTEPEIPRVVTQNSSQRSILGSIINWSDIFKRDREEIVDAHGNFEISKSGSLSLQEDSLSITAQFRKFMEENFPVAEQHHQTSPEEPDEQSNYDDTSIQRMYDETKRRNNH